METIKHTCIDIPEYKGAGIYRIGFGTSGQRYYIGQSKNVKNRLHQHVRDLARGVHINASMQTAYNRGEKFTIEIVEEISLNKTLAYMLEREAEEIEKIHRYNLANTACGTRPSLEFHEKYLRSATRLFRQSLDSLESYHRDHERYWLPMDGSETPEISPARRAYNFALAILNDWIEQEEQK